MYKHTLKILGILVLTVCQLNEAHANTITVVTKGASADGSMLVSCSNDGFNIDPSITFIDSKKHKDDTLKDIFPVATVYGEIPDLNCTYVPRLNDKSRTLNYYYKDLKETLPIGKILQEQKTYAYLDGDSGIINEYGLCVAVSTNHTSLYDYIDIKEASGVFCAQELSRIALERCKTAHEAVLLVGSLIDTYGLWGKPQTLVIADKTEAYCMEMMPYLDKKHHNQAYSFWIAKKIEDGTFFVSADQFKIRAIDKNDDTLIYKPNLDKLLKELKLAKINKDGLVDWLTSVKGTEIYPYYSMRRVWRGYSIMKHSAHFSPYVKGYDDSYPFSVIPDKTISTQDLMMLHRDTYAGPQFDSSTKESGGFFASPYTYDKYESERAFNNASTTYTTIAQVGKALPAPIAWIAINTPAENSFVPLCVAKLPDAYTKVSRANFDKTKLWWSASFVGTLTKAYYFTMIDNVKIKAMESEQRAFDLLKEYQNVSKNDFFTLINSNAILLVNKWHNLYHKLLEIHDNGFKLRYAEGHNPKFTPVDKYRKKAVKKPVKTDDKKEKTQLTPKINDK